MFTPDADLSRVFGLDADWLVATGFAWINLIFIIIFLAFMLSLSLLLWRYLRKKQ